MGEDKTVEHVVLECEMYDRDIMKLMRLILTEMRREMNEVIERTGLCGETSERIINAVKLSPRQSISHTTFSPETLSP